MQNYEIILWSALASIIRLLKEYLKTKSVSIFKSLFIVTSGVASAALFSMPLLSSMNLPENYLSAMSFIVGLLGKEIVEIILTVDLRPMILKMLNTDDNTIEESPKRKKSNNRRTNDTGS